MIRLAACALLVVLAGCGQRETLHPAEGRTLPVKPAMAATQPTAEDLMTPTTTERPERSDELLKQSIERPDDRFNLPPGD